MAEPSEPESVRMLEVHFTPGSRTGWHSHAGGQLLHVIAGTGVVVNNHGNKINLEAGDTIETPADDLHWHGAAPDSPLLQVSITTKGRAQWTGDSVGDADYLTAFE